MLGMSKHRPHSRSVCPAYQTTARQLLKLFLMRMDKDPMHRLRALFLLKLFLIRMDEDPAHQTTAEQLLELFLMHMDRHQYHLRLSSAAAPPKTPSNQVHLSVSPSQAHAHVIRARLSRPQLRHHYDSHS